MVLMLSAWMFAILLEMFVSISNLSESILFPTVLLTLIFWIRSSKDVLVEDSFFFFFKF